MTSSIDIESERFWTYVQKMEHWLWLGAIDAYGYGRYGTRDGSRAAHVYAYELKHGPLPPGMELHHTCQHKHCVLHVALVKKGEHVARHNHLRGSLSKSGFWK